MGCFRSKEDILILERNIQELNINDIEGSVKIIILSWNSYDNLSKGSRQKLDFLVRNLISIDRDVLYMNENDF